jgi:hypothetical protein
LSFAVVKLGASTLATGYKANTDTTKRITYLGWAESDFNKHIDHISQQVFAHNSLIGTQPHQSLKLVMKPLHPQAWVEQWKTVAAQLPSTRTANALTLDLTLGFTVVVI